MKKLTFALACIIGMMFFASCTQEQIDEVMAQKPTVEFMSDEGLTSGDCSVYIGSTLNFKVMFAPNSGSESPIVNFDYSITNLDGVVVFNEKPEITDPSGENYYEMSFTPEEASTYAITATVTDEAGKVNVAKIIANFAQPTVAEIGVFSGTININGHVTTNEVAGYTYDDDYNMEGLATTITLGALDDNNRVSATIEIDGTPVTLYGTMEENNITFDQFHFHKTINITVEVTIDLAMDLTGVLQDDILTLSGTAAGSGSTMVIFVEFTANYEGTVEGALQKEVAAE